MGMGMDAQHACMRLSHASPCRPMSQLLKRAPHVWVVPLLTVIVLIVFSEVAVYLAADNYRADQKDQASNIVDSKIVALESALLGMQGPLIAVSALVSQVPDIRNFNARFADASDLIFKELDPMKIALTIKVLPFGVISAMWPRNNVQFATFNFDSWECE